MKSKKYIAAVLVVLVIIIGLGVFVWYRNTLSKAITERENAETRLVQNDDFINSGETIKSGRFVNLDPIHYGSGGVNINKTGQDVFVEFAEDFETNPDGPDLYVWLVSEQNIGGAIGGVDTDPDTFLELGPLDKFEGKQSYRVSQAEFEKFDYAVVIWCKAFGIQFTNAILE